MKQFAFNPVRSNSLSNLLKTVFILVAFIIPASVFAQSNNSKKQTTVPPGEISITPVLTFTSIQKAGKTIDLKSSIKFKQKGVSVKLPLLKVKCVLVTDTAVKDLGFVITDRNGLAVLSVKTAALAPDKEGKLHFKAVFAGNKQMEAAEAESTIKKAILAISPVKADAVLSAKIKLTDALTGAAIPKVTVGIFVKRSFFPLKIGEGTTDENGEASVEVPNNLPGDVTGAITLIARLDENETYGNVEADSKQPWGLAVSDKAQALPRALWSTHPPLWMLFTFLILVTVVWGHYIVIIFELFRLRKEEPHPAAGAGS